MVFSTARRFPALYIVICAITLLIMAWPTRSLANQAAPAANALPHTLFTAEYRGKFDGWKVKMKRTLTQTHANAFTLSSNASNFFASVQETSRFLLVDGKLRPLSYTYKRKVFGKKKTEALTFDWGGERVSYTRSDKSEAKSQPLLSDDILDPSIYQLVLQADMYTKAESLKYEFIKRDRTKTYQFKAIGEEAYQLGKEKHTAQRVRRENSNRSKRTTVWLVPSMDYQLAKIEHVDDGDTYELLLKSYSSDTEAVREFLFKVGDAKSKRTLTPTTSTTSTSSQ